MSWDIFVQDLPESAVSIDDIPADFEPQTLPHSRAQVIDAILAIAPFADASNPSWIRIDGQGVDLEVSLGDDENLSNFAFHVSGGEHSSGFVAEVLRRLGLRALDPASDTGFFDAAAAAVSFAAWQARRDSLVGG